MEIESKDDSLKNNGTVSEESHGGKEKDLSVALENVLHHAGEMGLYQILLFIGMLPFGFFWAFGYLGQMFITATPQDHWCFVPELSSLDMELRRNLSIPGDGSDWDHCRMFDADWSAVLDSLTPPSAGTPTVPCQHGWEFVYDDIPYSTVVSEREWVCDKANLVPWSQTITFIGSIFGGVVIGHIADTFGRLPALIFSNLVGFVGGVATVFTQGFWDFSACRFLVGMSVDGCFMMFYILAMEYVGTSHRTWVSNMSIALFYGGGCVSLPFLALWISDWKVLTLVMAVPMLLVLVTPFTVPESTRWLVTQGKIDKAVKMLRRFERINKTKIPKDALDEFVYIAKTSKEPKEGVKVLFTNPALRTTLVLTVMTFMCIAIVFDIQIRMSESLGGDFFITFALSSSTEVPSVAILVFLLDRFGRRWLTFGPIAVTGLLTLAAAFVPRGVPTVALAVAARFVCNMSYNTIIQFTPELLPTGYRASGTSFVHVIAFTGALITPFVVYSERVWLPMPLLIGAVVAALGGLLALLLPETMGRPIPQTLQDGVRLANTGLAARMCGGSQGNDTDMT